MDETLPPPARLFVYRPGAIGDFILALPALQALRAAYPSAAITVVAHPAAVELARAVGLADATLAADSAILTPLFASKPPTGDSFPIPTAAVLWAGSSADRRLIGGREFRHPRLTSALTRP